MNENVKLLQGRRALEHIVDPETGEILVKRYHIISAHEAERILYCGDNFGMHAMSLSTKPHDFEVNEEYLEHKRITVSMSIWMTNDDKHRKDELVLKEIASGISYRELQHLWPELWIAIYKRSDEFLNDEGQLNDPNEAQLFDRISDVGGKLEEMQSSVDWLDHVISSRIALEWERQE